MKIWHGKSEWLEPKFTFKLSTFSLLVELFFNKNKITVTPALDCIGSREYFLVWVVSTLSHDGNLGLSFFLPSLNSPKLNSFTILNKIFWNFPVKPWSWPELKTLTSMAKTRHGLSAAKPKPGKKDLDSYTVRGTNKVVRGTVFSIYILRICHKKLLLLLMSKMFSGNFRILAFRVYL